MKQRFISALGDAPPVDLRQALLEPLAPNGGLYLPREIEPLPEESFARWSDQPWPRAAVELATSLLPEIPPAEMERLVLDAFSFPLPLVEVEPGRWILELFHGPTLSFKDYGARFMARLLSLLEEGERAPLTVLVATSGDTGSAVAQAFQGVDQTRVAVLFPRGKISRIQESQICSGGDNVQAIAVEGSFDDCQRMVKAAFADAALKEDVRLTSANSINLGRLLPQSFYYAHAAAQMGRDVSPRFVVPSGNFGNLTAGLLAERMGLRVDEFIAATNANDVVPQYLATGELTPRPSVATLSNAMDVGDPSNFQRMNHLFRGGVDEMRERIRGVSCSDEETRDTIRDVYRSSGAILDPHTAVGYRALEVCEKEGLEPKPTVILGTAHPVKFREEVEPLIGRKIPVPERLADELRRACDALPLPPEESSLIDFLRHW